MSNPIIDAMEEEHDRCIKRKNARIAELEKQAAAHTAALNEACTQDCQMCRGAGKKGERADRNNCSQCYLAARVIELEAERDELQITVDGYVASYDAWAEDMNTRETVEREACRQDCIKAIVDNCAGCGGSGHDERSTDECPRQCEYCGRQIDAMNIAIRKRGE